MHPSPIKSKYLVVTNFSSLKLLLISGVFFSLLTNAVVAQQFTPRKIDWSEFKSCEAPAKDAELGAVYLIKVKASAADNARQNGGMYATVDQDGKANSTRIYQLEKQPDVVEGGRHQQWLLFRSPDAPVTFSGKPHYSYYIVGRSSGLLATVQNASKGVIDIYLWEKDLAENGNHQKFFFVEDEQNPGSYTIRGRINTEAFWTRDQDGFGNYGNIVQGNVSSSRWEFFKTTECNFKAAPEPTPETKIRQLGTLSRNLPTIEWKNGNPIFPEPKEAFHKEFRYINSALVRDLGMSPADRMAYSPHYRIVKEAYYVPVGSIDNTDSDGKSEAPLSIEWQEGFSQTEMNSFTHSFSFTFGTGEKSLINLQATYGFAFTKEESETLSRGKKVTQAINIAPGSAGAVYAIEYRYRIERLDGQKIHEWKAGDKKTHFKVVTSQKPIG